MGSAEARSYDPLCGPAVDRRDDRRSNPGAAIRVSSAPLRGNAHKAPWSRRIIGIAPVSKTGAREGVWVRIPPAPLYSTRTYDE